MKRIGFILLVALFVLCTAVSANAQKSLAKLPSYFEENQGQFAADVKFLSRGLGYTLVTRDSGPTIYLGHDALGVKLLGSNPRPQLSGETQLEGKTNYLIGNDSARWKTNVTQFGQVRYSSVYEGIDVVYYSKDSQLEYDFVLQPGANPDQIAIEFTKAGRLRIDRNGDLLVKIGNRELRQRRPLAYQESSSGRSEVRADYMILAKNRVGFRLGTYDRAKTLVIDPILIYSTYFGGTGGEDLVGAATDASGNLYVTGRTDSSNFPTVNALQPTAKNTNSSIFLAKFAPGGNLVYSTYIGGSFIDWADGIAVNPHGQVFLLAESQSDDFPLKNSRGWLPFVLKIDSNGQSLLWLAPFPGPAVGTSTAIAVDSTSNVYVAGYRPIPQDRFAADDAVIAKFDPNGNLLFSKQFGGQYAENATAIAADSAGNFIVVGNTNSPDFPVSHAWQAQLRGAENAYVIKFDSAGNVIFSTYLGGSSMDVATSVGIDAAQNIFIAGHTESPDFPLLNPLQTNYVSGDFQGFVAKLNATGVLQYSTYLGGSARTIVEAIRVESDGTAYIDGWTGAIDFPVVKAVQTARAGTKGFDAFLSKLDPTGSVLLFSTYFGGSDSDFTTSMAIDSSGSAYVVGNTLSTDLPVNKAVQGLYHGGSGLTGQGDGFIAKIDTIRTRLQEDDSHIQYTGTWYTNSMSSHSGGHAVLALDTGARATFTFNGTEARWVAYQDPWSGIANVYVDGVLQTPVDLYSPMGNSQAIMYTTTALAAGTHTLAIEVTGRRNPSAQSSWIWIDAFDVTP